MTTMIIVAVKFIAKSLWFKGWYRDSMHYADYIKAETTQLHEL